ncbi:DNA-binding NtrC family response regulator [Mycobacterium sp. URHB0021]
MTRVLVIDDEAQILRALRINLSVRGSEAPRPEPMRCVRPPTTAPTSSC